MPDAEADYEIDWDDNVPVAPARPPVPVRAAIPVRADRDLAEVQASAAAKDIKDGVVATGDTVELLGEKFRIADRIGLMPLLKFASASDVDVQDPRALSAMYALLRDCIYAGTPACGECETCEAGNDSACKSYDRGDWGRFEEHAMITKADADDLMEVVQKVLEIVSGRPTPPRSGSSAGVRRTQRASTGSKSGGRGRASRR